MSGLTRKEVFYVMHKPPQTMMNALTRRHFLQGTMGGIAGLVAWQGWPRLRTAMTQKAEPSG